MSQPDASSDASDAGASTFPEVGALVVVRHGQTEWSSTGRHTGITDVPLTTEGERQATYLRDPLGRYDFAYVSSSPRKRAQHTAALAGFADPHIDPDLAEWDYGTYEGMTRSQIRRIRPGWTIWTGTPVSGETVDEVTTRARRVIETVSTTLYAGKDVLVFSHGHFCRVLLTAWLGLPTATGAHFVLDPATISVLTGDRGDRVVRNWNAIPTAPMSAVEQTPPTPTDEH